MINKMLLLIAFILAAVSSISHAQGPSVTNNGFQHAFFVVQQPDGHIRFQLLSAGAKNLRIRQFADASVSSPMLSELFSGGGSAIEGQITSVRFRKDQLVAGKLVLEIADPDVVGLAAKVIIQPTTSGQMGIFGFGNTGSGQFSLTMMPQGCGGGNCRLAWMTCNGRTISACCEQSLPTYFDFVACTISCTNC